MSSLSFFKKVRESQKNDQLIKAILTLKIPAGEASSKAPLGPTLGQYGIQISEFCTMFNKLSEEYYFGTLLVTKIILFADMGYDLYIVGVSIPLYLKKILNTSTFSPYAKKVMLPNSLMLKKAASTVVLYELVNFKYGISSLLHIPFFSYYKSVCASVRSYGVLLFTKKAMLKLQQIRRK